MTARSVLLLFPFIMYFAHRTDGCQQKLYATEMQWLDEELADLKFAQHNIEGYKDAILDHRKYRSLNYEINQLVEKMTKELVENVYAKIEANQMKDFDWISQKYKRDMYIAEKKKKEMEELEAKLNLELRQKEARRQEVEGRVFAEREKARQRELQRQKEEEEDEKRSRDVLALQNGQFFAGAYWGEHPAVTKWNARKALNKSRREHERELERQLELELVLLLAQL
ncbi:uncharacterized protein LOC129927430 isoform X2 [Biomphalaria glabrata]|uniref:Uncharacterized protein LOC129927430 isoform X2 n=1 Tax=Biomphalaria glabrata TaxID=6526 RepID=A0A9W3AZ72_BIOGL|nr:uncharacterized protein LOC129927430 isoform X2 [Biomphalaria glabrata]